MRVKTNFCIIWLETPLNYIDLFVDFAGHIFLSAYYNVSKSNKNKTGIEILQDLVGQRQQVIIVRWCYYEGFYKIYT